MRLLDDCYILILLDVEANGVASSSADVQTTSQLTGEKLWDIARLVSGENTRPFSGNHIKLPSKCLETC